MLITETTSKAYNLILFIKNTLLCFFAGLKYCNDKLKILYNIFKTYKMLNDICENIVNKRT